MRRNANAGLGAFHPILFFVIVYAISLFLAFFVCNTVYHAFNGDAMAADEALMAQSTGTLSPTATAYR